MKRNLLCILALVMGVTLSAFTTAEKSRTATLNFYSFTGQAGTDDENDPTKYVEDADQGCTTGSIRCGVYANPGVGDHPDLSSGFTFVNKN